MNTLGARMHLRDSYFLSGRKPLSSLTFTIRDYSYFPIPTEWQKVPGSAGDYVTQIISFVQFAIVSFMSG